MLARRGRFNIKPNLAKGGRSEETKTPKEAVDIPEPPPVAETIVPETRLAQTVSATTAEDEGTPVWPSPEKKRVSRIPVVSPARSDVTDLSPDRKNEKKKFNGGESLDTKKMRIMDMIYWNPKGGQLLSRKRLTTESSTAPPTPTRPANSSASRPAAPQVKIGPDGTIVLDESSLVIEGTQNDTSFWETVDDDRMGRKTTSLSFRNRLWRKGTQWTDKETELFYEILRCTGPDFSLMHEYFPARARCELKSKYNREEKNNWPKLKNTMSTPSVLDESLLNRVERLKREIEEEAEEKANSKDRMKKMKGQQNARTQPREPVTIDWDEATADLVAEAEEIIHELENEAKRRAREAGTLDESSTSSGESSGDEDFVKRPKTKRKKISLDARKLISAARKQAMETETAKRAEEKKNKRAYKGFDETEDLQEDPDTVREAYPVPKSKRDGVIAPALIRAARQAKKVNEQRNEQKKVAATAETSSQDGEGVDAAAKGPEPSRKVPVVVEEEELTLKTAEPRALTRSRRPPNLPKKTNDTA